LSTSASNGLAVTVTQCSIAWVVAANAGTCAGTTTTLLTSTALSALATRTAFAGPVNPTPAQAFNLRVTVALPTQNETTTNGTLPGSTIQGLSAALTFTFSEDQRAAVTNNS
ncbi:MAG: hypothetical protein ABIO67_07665, partial [Mycobacteriales bacterium]